MKYILVTGGPISGVGKGVIASSIGAILRSHGLHLNFIKIDPYLNQDAGTFSPYEHGETFVLNDGGEVDLDLGNYERFLDISLTKKHNITTGKVYQRVLNQERDGKYLGKTVQIIPHITDEIKRWVSEVGHYIIESDNPCNNNKKPDICIIELGGTVGDIEGMPFIEAFRQFQFDVGVENIAFIHVSLIPFAGGEPKTKPTQVSTQQLRTLGISPDIIIGRSEEKITTDAINKIASFCNVDKGAVFSVPNFTSIYSVPILLSYLGISRLLQKRLNLTLTPMDVSIEDEWRLLSREETHLEEIIICIIGKYTKLADCYTSIRKALEHAGKYWNVKIDIKYVDAESLESKDDENWQIVYNAHGIVIPGGFGTRGLEGKILGCEFAREANVPFLGICLGFQAAVIEFCRNVVGFENANTAENIDSLDVDDDFIIVEMPEHNTSVLGGTMRLGAKQTFLTTSKVKTFYGKDSIFERHRHRFEVDIQYLSSIERKGMKFVGKDITRRRMSIFELTGHDYFIGCQFHPEYQSKPMRPAPLLLGLVNHAIAYKSKLTDCIYEIKPL